ncbi:MAG TPA: CdaR family protein, partial [Candidatus Tectomicrobia bacterium]|nr:CdaR family protein [Candidatus Tectomicrobia bacterium]
RGSAPELTVRRARVLADWELRALALVLAAATWLYVVSGERAEVALAVPVEYVGLEGPYTLVGPRRETVDVQLEAPRWAADRITPTALRVRVDVAALHEGENLVRLQPEHVQAPAGVRVNRVSPSWLSVRLAPAATKSVSVIPQILGAPAPNHALHAVAVEPSVVQIRGPRTTIEARRAVETLPVDVSGRREPVTLTVGLDLPEAAYAVDRRTVQVTVDIRPEETMPQPAGARR